jgi:hypothetical protein
LRVIVKEIPYSSRDTATQVVVPISCIHLGAKGCDKDLLENVLKVVSKTPNAWIIGMGDYGDCINASDRRHDYATIDCNYMTPNDQYNEIENLFREHKDKILGILDGNHEYDFWNRTGHHYARTMAENLGVEYGTFSTYFRLKLKRLLNTKNRGPGANLDIYAHHGWSSARSDGGAVNSIYDLRNKFNSAHIYIMGHIHHKIGAEPPKVACWIPDVYRKHGNYSPIIRENIQQFVWAGSYLKLYEDNKDGSGYAERRGYNPAALGSPFIEIKPNRVDDHGPNDKMAPPFSVRVSTLDFLS